MSDLMIQIGRRLRQAREQKGLSLIDLAKRTGAYNSNLSCYETGKRIPSLEIFLALAMALEVSADYLLGIDATVGLPDDAEVAEIVMDLQVLTPQERQLVAGVIKLIVGPRKGITTNT